MAYPVEQTIQRDPALFWWILLPITVVMILTGILRHYLTQLIQSPPKPLPLPKLRENRSLARGTNLRANSSVLSPSSYQTRKQYLIGAFKDGVFLADPEGRGKPKASPMTDPAAMEGLMNGMKGNVAMMVPQTLIMSWINAFFAGFVILKLPFPLTPQFKSMLQSGVGTRDLDVRWVSSLSWYFLTLFGLQPVYNFILGSSSHGAAVQQQMAAMNPAASATQGGGGGLPGMGGQDDPDKLFRNEAENLEVAEHRWVCDGVEERILFAAG